eukprot:2390291-Rhodomonas_salina.1
MAAVATAVPEQPAMTSMQFGPVWHAGQQKVDPGNEALNCSTSPLAHTTALLLHTWPTPPGAPVQSQAALFQDESQ